MRKALFFTFKLSSLTVALIIGLIGVLNFSIAASAPTKSVSEWLFGQSATRLSSGVVKACADETRGDGVTVADCIAHRGNQLLRNSTLSLGENLVETSGSTLFGENFKLKSQLSWGDGSDVQGELDAVIPVWSAAQTKSLFIQPGIAIWPGLGKQKRKRTDANLGLVYRSLNSGGDALFGGSIFYDRNLDHDNQRLALGFDVQSQLGYASFNYYHPLSNDWRQGRSGFEERALRGYDFSLEKLFYHGRIDVEANFGAWRRNQPSKWVYTYGVDLGYKVNNYLSLNLGYEDFSGQPLSGLPSNQRWQIGLKLDLMKLYAPKPAQHAGNQSPLDLWRTVTREKRILYQERVADTIISFAASNYSVVGSGRATMVELIIKASEPLSKDVALTYSTRDGSATAGSDYEAKNGSLTIKAGDTTSETIQIKIIANTVGEAAEQFSVDLSLSTATAGVRVNPATVTITINPAPALRLISIGRLTAASSNGTTNSNTVSWLITFNKQVQNVDKSDFVLNAGGSSNGTTLSSAPIQSNGTAGQNIGASNFALNAGGSSTGPTIYSVTLRNNDTEVVTTAYSSNEGALSLSFSSSNDIADRIGNRLLNTIPTSGVNQDTFILDNTIKPVITLNGPVSVRLEVGSSYTKLGARASDNIDGDISANIVISGSVDANAVGIYSVSYNVSDSAGNAADTVTRTVTVVDTTLPVITLNGLATVSLEVGSSYTEAGATASDNVDGDITANIVISGSVDVSTVGIYSVSYNVNDAAGNAADEVTREVIVSADVTKPVITLLGPASISFEVGGSYTEAGATAHDNIDGQINSRIVIDSTKVDANNAGIYSVTYNVSDIARNAADEVTREVIVSSDVTKPVITLTGPASISFEVGGSYTEAGATANDNIDGQINSRIVTDSTNVDANAVGTYSVTYKVSDIAGNDADEVTRAVIVTADVTKPVITLTGPASISFEVGGSYTEAGATANDNIDGQINSRIVIDSTNVDANAVGTYSVTYKVSDIAGNDADEVTRAVIVTADVTKPVITLTGPARIGLELGSSYTEAGATASDNIDGPIDSSRIVIDSTNVDVNAAGTYSVTYNVSDNARNAADEVTREVIVSSDVTKPVITLTGPASISFEVGGSYTEAGATAQDNIDGPIDSSRIVIDSTKVDVNAAGTYSVTYNVSDNARNAADEVTREVIVTADVTKPVITLTGPASISFEVGGSYTEAGATANDNIDGQINSRIVIDSTNVDANAVGTYSVTYNVSDNARNEADTVTRAVIVTADVTKPVITLTGPASISFEVGGSYTEAGATANDNIDGQINSRIVIDSTSVDANAAGTYSVTYNVSDIAGNDADEVTRAVIVTADVTKPVITLTGPARIGLELGSSYTEAGATASDNIDGPIDSSRIVIDSTNVDVNAAGTYSVTYNVSDNARNAADEITREVIVSSDVTKPVITLTGPASISFEVGGSYTEAGATAQDNIDGQINSRIVIDSTNVDANAVGTYSVTYNVSDIAGNDTDEVTREVIVTADKTKPVITLNGPATVSLELGRSYTDEGATATDNIDGDITSAITTTNPVDTTIAATYTITYKVIDAALNAAEPVTRTVIVTADVTKPVITLNGPATVSLELGRSYTDEGATATDNIDGDITGAITTTNPVDTNIAATYTITYKVIDAALNAAEPVTRTVIVTADVTKPVITRLGEATVSLELGRSYSDEGATATDNIDGDITGAITTTNPVDTTIAATYTITYKVIDAALNAAEPVTRTVIVTADVTKPVITLNGPVTVSLELGRSYTDEGATATDNIDGDITSAITTTNPVDTTIAATYTITYKVIDAALNAADPVTRTVIVTADVTKPVITRLGEATVSLELGSSYSDEGATATDNIDGDITGAITTTNPVDTTIAATYTITYKVIDAALNAAEPVTRTVIVTADVTKPVITLNGPATVSLELGRSYTDEGATATDNIDGDITGAITTTNPVDTNIAATYTITYKVIDAALNAAEPVTRTVNVTADVTKPVITLNGPATVSLELGRSYTDEGATATDNIDRDITSAITTTNPVDTNIAATYTITYKVIDAALNAADPVTRTVIVTADVTKPVITRLGEATVSLELGSSYSDEGATATDNIDGDITGAITTTNPVDTTIAATYTITYKVIDAALNAADPVTRTVIVTADVTKPVITLNGPATVSLELGRSYSDEGATATDNIDGDITGAITTTNPVDTNIAATYTITYKVMDAALNAADPVTRTVIVTADVTKPVITLNGPATVSLELGSSYTDEGATATDNIDGDITSAITTSNPVDTNIAATYTITYKVIDAALNAAEPVTRTVIVTADVTKPVITRLGEATVSLELGSSYSDEGATATDNIDGDITGAITTTNPVDTTIAATYTITYNVIDAALNAADPVTRTVIVTADVTKPVITRLGEATVSLELGSSYSDEGATATDNIDGDITGAIATSNPVDTTIAATYTITYNVIDAALNAAEPVTREVIVTADVTKPVITLNGPATVSLELGRSYSDEGATATDNIDGDITGAITTTNPVDTTIAATYTITYKVIDAALNAAEPVTRTVIVTADVTKPVITRLGEATVSLELGSSYSDEGATATDNIDGDITGAITTTNPVDTNIAATYTITYKVIDAALNAAEPVTRTVIVTADVTKPVITRLGEATVSLELGSSYSDEGATATDNIDGDITGAITTTNPVDTTIAATYTITYKVIDAALNAAEPVTRTVIVTADVTKPVITRLGEATVSLELGSSYSDEGATATDNIDGDITSAITTTNPVDTNIAATYTITYKVIDAALNAADPVTRTVIVTADVTKPVITRLGEATVSLELGSSYSDEGATATDNIDGDITGAITTTNPVDTNIAATYTITYKVIDAALNAADPVTRTVIVTADVTKPVITRLGEATVSLELGSSYSDEGATATDNIDGDITGAITTTNPVDTTIAATYTITYNVIDAALNAADPVTRTVIVTADVTKPVITLTGPASISFEVGGSYTEAGATANDNIDGQINSRIVIDSTNVDANAVGTYSVTYNVSDIAGNDADEVTREVIVSSDVTKPVITLTGPASISFEVGGSYTEAGATANDNIDGQINSRIVIDSTNVDANAVGTYSVTYNVSDNARNAADEVTRAVIVTADVTKPVIILTGPARIGLELGSSYTEAGATASDNIDGPIDSSRIVIDSTNVDVNAAGTYSVTYNVSDNARNAADEVTREVIVSSDVTKPVITLTGPASISFEVGGSYTEAGATAQDNIDGQINSRIVIDSTNVDANAVGTYSVTYNVSDIAGNDADEVTRAVIVTADVTKPVITLTGPASISFEVGGSYTEAGATANDNIDGQINSRIVIDSTNVDANAVGTYSVTYNVSDIAGNDADEVTREVIVSSDVTKPVITLTGPASISFEVGGSYTEAGATANDNIDGQINSRIVIDSTNVDVNAAGTYSVTYNVSDNARNAADEVTREVIVSSDVTKPVITLTGPASISFEVGGSYTEAGATAQDNIDGQINSRIVIDSTNVDANAVGTYSVTYNVSDIAGNDADEVTRAVIVTADVTKPVITLTGPASISFEVGGSYTEAGATANDNIDGQINSRIVIGGDTVDANTVGTYSVTYNVSDSAANAADEVTREVTVTADSTKPVITLLGEATVSFEVGGSYTDAGATASDNIDGDVSANIVIGGDTVDANTVSIYSLSYNVVDNAGNAADEVTRTVNVTADVTKPVITLTGPASISFEVGGSYTEAGATANDNIDGQINSRIVIDSTNVDANAAGTYSVTYNVSDIAGNDADEVTRAVNVTADVTKPVITLTGPASISFEVGGSYTEAGATANDNIDGQINSRIVIDSTNVDANAAGTYSVTYNVSDNARNAADEVTRVVTVTATAPAAITNLTVVVAGDRRVTLSWTTPDDGGSPLKDYTLKIAAAGKTVFTLSPIATVTMSKISGLTNRTKYTFSLTATNAVGDSPTATVTATPVAGLDMTKPVITLLGNATVSLEVGSSYTDAGATASDNVDGDISANIVIGGDSVDANTVSIYTLSYNVVDNAGNAADTVTRTVNVTDTTLPVITLNGSATVSLEVGYPYIEVGATASDNVDGDITNRIMIHRSSSRQYALGRILSDYTVSYNVSDSAGNAADTVTRTVNVTVDMTKPVITLKGLANVSLEVGSSYTDAGATANDNIDGDISRNIVISGSVDASKVGSYTFRYNVSDINNNTALTVIRTINVTPDVTKPVITLRGKASETLLKISYYVEAGASASDNVDGDISNRIVMDTTPITSSHIFTNITTYTFTYNVTDSAGNVADEVTRTVTVHPDVTKPVITLLGDASISFEVGSSYTEADATASDNVDGDISANIVISGSVDANTVGTYSVTYNVADDAGNAADTVTRTVTVVDTTLPVITLNGLATAILEVGSSYIDAGATAHDNVDGDISDNIVIDSTKVDNNIVGIYSVSYNVSDSAGNAADEVTRTVNVSLPDETKPVITLNGPATISLEASSSYTDAGARASDNVDGDISANIVIDSTQVDSDRVGIYSVTYNVRDAAGNAAGEVTRTVNVTADVTKPVITLIGSASLEYLRRSFFYEPGATATDNADGNISHRVVIRNSGSAYSLLTGMFTYTYTYNVTDSSGNAADEVTRTITTMFRD